jgi:hypothetical protein
MEKERVKTDRHCIDCERWIQLDGYCDNPKVDCPIIVFGAEIMAVARECMDNRGGCYFCKYQIECPLSDFRGSHE